MKITITWFQMNMRSVLVLNLIDAIAGIGLHPRRMGDSDWVLSLAISRFLTLRKFRVLARFLTAVTLVFGVSQTQAEVRNSFPASAYYVPWNGNAATPLGPGHWSTPEIATQRWAVGRDLSCGNPDNGASATYDHVQQQFSTAPYYDFFFDGYWTFTPCRPGGLAGTFHGNDTEMLFTGLGGALRVDVCPANTVLTTTVIGLTKLEATCTPIGADPGKNPGPPKCPTCAGNPINFTTGNKYQQQTEYRGGGPFPLAFGWTYNSLDEIGSNQFDDFVGPLGKKRRHSYQRQVQLTSNTTVTSARVQRPDGKSFVFNMSGANSWTPEADVADRLVRLQDAAANTTGWQYILQADDSTENYDANGRLLSIVTRAGLTQTMGYNAAGQLISVTDDFGHGLGLGYDAVGRLNQMTDPAGGMTLFAFDASGNLTTVTYPDGHSRSYVYNEAVNITSGNSQPYALTGIIDENGSRFATFKYTNYGAAESTEHAGGVEKYSAWRYGSIATLTDPLGTVSTTNFSSILGVHSPNTTTRPCSTLGCSGTVNSAYGYDANGNVSQKTDFKGNVTNYVYDLSRNLETSRTEAAGTAAARTIKTTWNANYRLPATITEPAAGGGSKVTTNSYDASGNLTQRVVTTPQGSRTWSWTYDVYGRVLTVTDARGNTSINTYYPNDPAQGPNRGQLASVANAAGHTTTIGNYNAHGQPQTMTDPNSLVTTIAYDSRQRLTSRTVGGETTTYTYDPVGQLTKVTLPDGSYLIYTYDAAHRLTQIQDGLGNRLIYTLDNMGNRIKEDAADPNNALARTRSRVYDSLNRLKQDIGGANPATEITQYSYDDNNNQIAATDPLSRLTSNSYDALNRLIQVTDPASGLTKYEYDAQDNLTKVTDPKNIATAYSYNGFNEMVTQVSPDTGTTAFTYDAAGNLLTKTDARNVTATYNYDALNRVTTITYPDETVTYTYDSCGNGKGRLCSLTDKTGTTAYSYDLHGRVTAKSQTVNGLTQTVGYAYNGAGQMTGMTLPSGSVVNYSYVNNRITSIMADGAAIVSGVEYEPFGPVGEWAWGNNAVGAPNRHMRYFDLDGRNTKIESAAGLEPTIIVYDAASRITALQKLAGNAVDPTKSFGYGYDNLDRLISVTPGAGNPAVSQGYTYDAIGNRLSNIVDGSVTTYKYGTNSHRLNGVVGATAKNYIHDAAGNRTGDGAQTWIYGGNNRPTQINVQTISGVVSVLTDINALGQRVRKTTLRPGASPDVMRFVYDEAGHLLGEYRADGTPIREHLWLNDLPVGVAR